MNHSPPYTTLDVDTQQRIGAHRTRSLTIAFERGYRYIGANRDRDFVVIDISGNPIPRPTEIAGISW